MKIRRRIGYRLAKQFLDPSSIFDHYLGGFLAEKSVSGCDSKCLSQAWEQRRSKFLSDNDPCAPFFFGPPPARENLLGREELGL